MKKYLKWKSLKIKFRTKKSEGAYVYLLLFSLWVELGAPKIDVSEILKCIEAGK